MSSGSRHNDRADTHALVWWVTGDDLLSDPARKAIDVEMSNPGGQIIVPAISAWEVAMLVEKGRLILSMDVESWLDAVAEVEVVRFWPIDIAIALKSVALPGEFHQDLADRMIVATARKLAAPLVTKDEKIRAYKHVKSIW